MRPSLLLLFLLILSSHIIAQNGLKEDLTYEVNYTSLFGNSNSDTTIDNIVIPLTKKFTLLIDSLPDHVSLKSVSYMPENTQPGISMQGANNRYGPFSLANLSIIALKLSFVMGDSSVKTAMLKFVNESSEGDTTVKTPNFLAVSFIKSIAGTEVRDELMDIFIKINYGDKKRFFSMFGADAGINSKDSGSNSLMRLNEAVANMNYTIFRHRYSGARRDSAIIKVNRRKYSDIHNSEDLLDKGKSDWQKAQRKRYRRYTDSTDNIDLLKRVGFIGGGLKVFY